MGTFHSTKNHRQRKGGKSYRYNLQSFLKIRNCWILKNEPFHWKFREENSNGADIPHGFFSKILGETLQGIPFRQKFRKLRSIQLRKFPEMARVLGWMESTQRISLLAHFFKEVHYPGKDTKHSWQGWKSKTSTFAISSNCSKILKILKNFASSRTPVIQNIQPKMILNDFFLVKTIFYIC